MCSAADKREHLVALVLLGASMAACHATPNEARQDAQEAPAVDEPLARRRALEQYRKLFSGLYLKGPRSGELIPFPALDESYFGVVESRGEAWLVRSASQVGLQVVARVAKQGDLVEITSWAVVAE